MRARLNSTLSGAAPITTAGPSVFEVAIIKRSITNVLLFTIWMPVLDTTHAITIAAPTTQETVATNPLMPGLELHIPSGTVIAGLMRV